MLVEMTRKLSEEVINLDVEPGLCACFDEHDAVLLRLGFSFICGYLPGEKRTEEKKNGSPRLTQCGALPT